MFLAKKFIAVKMLAAFLAVAAFVPAQAQVTVVKSWSDKNPKLIFKGVSGNDQMSKAVLSDLQNCGWFDVVTSGTPDFIVSGTASGNSVNLVLANGAGTPMGTYSGSDAASASTASHRAVDAILKKNFGVSICCSRIAFCVETGRGIKEIYIADYDGQNARQLTRNNSLSVEPDWGHNSKSIVYTYYNRSSTDVVELDLGSNRTRRLTQLTGLNAGGAISPNGQSLAAILSLNDMVDLYVKPVSGGAPRRLTSGKAVEASPCWSPDGGQICFVSDQGSGRPKLYTISPSGGSISRVPTIGSEAASPSWSNDGKIAYSAKVGNYTIAVHDPSGKFPAKSIIETSGDWDTPSWAPDNRHLVATRKAGDTTTIYVIDTWTGKNRPVFSGRMNTSYPSWSELY